MTRPAGSSALSHLRVLDLTRARAGPTCCRILADFGADVLKIDASPGVDPNEIGLDRATASVLGQRHVIDDLSDERRLTELLRTERISHVIHCSYNNGSVETIDAGVSARSFNF